MKLLLFEVNFFIWEQYFKTKTIIINKCNGEKMFDWNKFVTLGYLLSEECGEGYVRSAIGRMYYGLFGVVRRYLINVCNKVNLIKNEWNIHGIVSDEL